MCGCAIAQNSTTSSNAPPTQQTLSDATSEAKVMETWTLYTVEFSTYVKGVIRGSFWNQKSESACNQLQAVHESEMLFEIFLDKASHPHITTILFTN